MLKSGGLLLSGMIMSFLLAACGNQEKAADAAPMGDSEEISQAASDFDKEFAEKMEQNPDIFGWLFVPGTSINYPVMQSVDGDNTYYQTHDDTGYNVSDKGGLYIESYNLMDMCDFNTVIHGATTSDGDMFSDLWKFKKSDYFKDHEQFFIFLPDNTLTYEIWTAYEMDNTNVFEKYDFTEMAGCEQYLADMKLNWTTATNFREGWDEGATAENFLVTLSTVDPQKPDKQWVVVGFLVNDEAGTIDRNMSSYEK